MGTVQGGFINNLIYIIMKVKDFTIEKSVFNKQMHVLVATTECGKKYVVSGDHYHPTYLIPYESSVDVSKDEKRV